MTGTATRRPRVLVVDDEIAFHEIFSRWLAPQADCETAADGDEALRRMREASAPFDVVISDLNMPGIGGMELARRIRAEHPLVEVIIVTGYADVDSAIGSLQLGVCEYLRKPVGSEQLLEAFAKAIEKKRLLESHQTSQMDSGSAGGLKSILGESEPMRRLRSAIVRVQNTELPVLVLGESGTGKELVARALHLGSHRSAGPFLAVNCAAIPRELLEAELFGHEAGTFTGANKSRKGLLESAAGGTFFLDEVGDCPLELQPKLLRAIQEREIMPVGGRSVRPVTARIVAATHRSLDAMVADGRFRQDLFYRLNTFPIRTPSLREIPEDLPLLVRHFLRTNALAFGRPPKTPSPELMAALAARQWPGNVRELQNTLSRIALLADGETYGIADLEASDGLDQGSAAPPPQPRGPDRLTELARQESPPPLDSVERAYVLAILERAGGKRSEAAALLGIHPATLKRKLLAWGAVEQPGE